MIDRSLRSSIIYRCNWLLLIIGHCHRRSSTITITTLEWPSRATTMVVVGDMAMDIYFFILFYSLFAYFFQNSFSLFKYFFFFSLSRELFSIWKSFPYLCESKQGLSIECQASPHDFAQKRLTLTFAPP